MQNQNFYFTLDSLIDTRIGLLMQHWPERVNAIDFSKYRNRTTSYVWEYFGLTKEDWVAKWDTRTADVLTHSGPAEMSLRLVEIFAGAVGQHIGSLEFEKPTMYINVWPYQLEAWEIEEIKISIKRIMVLDVDVEVLYVPLEELTPSYIKPRFDVMVMYDIVEWLGKHQLALTETQMPTVVIHYPAVLNEGDEEMVKKSQVTPFTQLRIYLAEYACFDALDVNLWCLPPVSPQPHP